MSLYEENIKQLNEISAFLTLTQPVAINKKYQCTISDAISAFKTLEDMGTPLAPDEIDVYGLLTIKVNPYVSRETLEEIAEYKCEHWDCKDCQYDTENLGCISELVKKVLDKIRAQGKEI